MLTVSDALIDKLAREGEILSRLDAAEENAAGHDATRNKTKSRH
ncbi:MAG: hypothetical protein ACRECV_00935 [Xanthobacteraceae bacterium]